MQTAIKFFSDVSLVTSFCYVLFATKLGCLLINEHVKIKVSVLEEMSEGRF